MTQAPTKDQQADMQHVLEQQEQAEKDALEEQERLQEEEISNQNAQAAEGSALASPFAMLTMLAGKPPDRRTLEEVAADEYQHAVDPKTGKLKRNHPIEADYQAKSYELENNYQQEKNGIETSTTLSPAQKQAELKRLADEKFGKFTIDPTTGEVTLHHGPSVPGGPLSHDEQAREAVFGKGVRGFFARNKYRQRENYIGFMVRAQDNPNIIALHNRIQRELDERFAAELTDAQRQEYHQATSLSKRDQEKIKNIFDEKQRKEAIEKKLAKQREAFLTKNGLHDRYNNLRKDIANHQLEIFKQRSPRLMRAWHIRQHLNSVYNPRLNLSLYIKKRVAAIRQAAFTKMQGFAQAHMPKLTSAITGGAKRFHNVGQKLSNISARIKKSKLFQFFNPKNRIKYALIGVALILLLVFSLVSSQNKNPVISPTANNCNGYYSKDMQIIPSHQNFGDPDCEFASNPAQAKDNLASYLKQSDPTNANSWFNMISIESSYDPNAYNPNSASGKGAYGLLQMNPSGEGNGSYDAGDVYWQVQISNGINFLKTNPGLNACNYWQSARSLGTCFKE